MKSEQSGGRPSDETAFQIFYRTHYPRLVKFAARRLGEARLYEDAEEIADDVFLKLSTQFTEIDRPNKWVKWRANLLIREFFSRGKKGAYDCESLDDVNGETPTIETIAAPIRQDATGVFGLDQKRTELFTLPVKTLAEQRNQSVRTIERERHENRKRLFWQLVYDHKVLLTYSGGEILYLCFNSPDLTGDGPEILWQRVAA